MDSIVFWSVVEREKEVERERVCGKNGPSTDILRFLWKYVFPRKMAYFRKTIEDFPK